MGEFGNIMDAYKSMKRTKTGKIQEHQPRGSASPLTEDGKDEIVELINATRKMNGQSELTETDIENQRVLVDENAPARITEQGVLNYANLLK